MAEEASKKRPDAKRHRSSKSKGLSKIPRYSITRRTGGKFGDLKPLFSKDEKYVFLCTKTQARVYSATNGDLVRSLSFKRTLKGPLVALFLHPTNEYRLITVSFEGQILVWDWTDGTLLQHSMIEPATEVVSAILVGTTFIWSDGKNIALCSDFPQFKTIQQVGRLSTCTGISANKENIFAYGDRSLLIFRLKEGGSTTEHEFLTFPTPLTTFAVCDSYFAYAESSGSIQVYQLNSFGKNKDTTPRRLHWHSSALYTMDFALNGEYLLSGGSEGVLVLWQLSTSNKQFLPRISRTISNIAVSRTSKHYALALDDNTIKIISASTLALETEIIGPRYSSGAMSSATQSNSVLLGNGAEVQVWDVPTGRTATRIPVTAQTFAGRVGDQYQSNEATVNACAVHGEWMATLDSWTTPKEDSVDLGQFIPRDETYLKFWKWDGKDYQLITRVDKPHAESRVFQIVAASNGAFYTTGEDASVKIWRQKPIKKDLVDGGTKIVGTTWSCRRVIRYTRLHGSCRMALSPDCSVLAIHTQDQTFLIDPVSGNLRTTIAGLSAGRVVELGFVRNYLVILGFKKIVVWDLLTSAVSYSLKIPDHTIGLSLACGDKTFILSTNEQTKQVKENAKVFVFDPESAKPIFREKCSRTLTVSWSPLHGFVQVTADLEIVFISESTNAPLEMTGPETVKSDNLSITPVYKVIRSQKAINSTAQKDVDMQESVLNTQAVIKIFEDPMKSLESRFEDLASLVLGVPKNTLEE